MRVLTVITESEKGGAQVHVADLVSGCRDYCEVALATGDKGYLTSTVEAMGVPSYVVPGLVRPFSIPADLRALAGLVRLIREVRPDVVHAHTYKAGLLGRTAAFMCGVPSVYTAHTWCFQPGTGAWWKKLGLFGEWFAARLSHRIITVSEANRDIARAHHVAARDRMEVVYNGIRDLDLRANPGSGHPPVIIMVARFVVQKDQAGLIEALAKVSAPWRLRFAGDGPTRSGLTSRVRELGLADRVEFLGDRNDIPQLLAEADIFALTTHLEGLPLGILEAMRAGLPVIASDIGGIREMLQDGLTGFLIPHGDSELLGRRLQTMLSRPELLSDMGLRGRHLFERQFGYQSMLTKTTGIYRSAIRRPEDERNQGEPVHSHERGELSD
jgi:glycosyltransferase involved in cell wall biosynthesis